MKRWHEEVPITTRNHREHLRSVHGWPKKPVTCVCDLQAGRFRKRDAYDCGNARCGICHYEKRFGHMETRQEARNRLSFQEQLKD